MKNHAVLLFYLIGNFVPYLRGRIYEYKVTAVVTGYWSGEGGGDLVLIMEAQPAGQRVEIHCEPIS